VLSLDILEAYNLPKLGVCVCVCVCVCGCAYRAGIYVVCAACRHIVLLGLSKCASPFSGACDSHN